MGEEVKKQAAELKAGDVLLLENLRYHAEEEKNDAAFSKQLADLADVYVNDAFGTAHRAHASTAVIVSAKAGMPAVAGFLMEKEIQYLGDAVANPERPFVAIIGGAKVSSKISVLKNILNEVDTSIIVGCITYTFFKSLRVRSINFFIGRSLY
ncbi:phosphoglycerate kinase [Brachyspira hyodysenteriae]|nr:phosphoglycerate kinase [Brachyspira hyodysenteriae]